MTDDAELLRRYAEHEAEEAFAELVRRHLDLVYSAALRQVGGDAHRAADVAQTVFIALARKAGGLASHTSLAGWLYTSTRFAASEAIRTERRRQTHESEAVTLLMNTAAPEPKVEWENLGPMLDAAMHDLGERDREAVLLRYFDNLPFAGVGTLLGVSEEAARKRVGRALDRLRDGLARRGIASTSAALGVVLANQAVGAAPLALGTQITTAALGAGTAGGGLSAGLLGSLAMTKLQTGLILTFAAALVPNLWWQYQRDSALKAELAAYRQENQKIEAAITAAARELQARVSPTATAGAPAVMAAATQTEPTEAERVSLLQRIGFLDRQYAGLFRRLALAPRELDALRELLLERKAADADVAAVVREGGLNLEALPVDLWPSLNAVATREVDERIRALLGEDKYSRFNAYLANTAQGNGQLFDEMTEILRYSNTPLSDEQADQLMALTRTARESVNPEPTAPVTPFTIPDAVVAAATEFLLPQQLQVLHMLKESRDGLARIFAMNRIAALEGRLELSPQSARHYPSRKGGGAPKP